MLAVVAVTLGTLLSTLWAAAPLDRQAVLAVARAQLLLMAAVIPIAAWPSRTRLDVLFRAGPTTDTFAVVVLAVALLSRHVTIGQVLGAYVLVAGVALAGMGLFASGRAVGLGRLSSACLAFALLILAAAGAFVHLPARVNVDLALRDLLQISRAGPGWLTTLSIALAFAGMVWTAGYLAERRRDPPSAPL
jgi:hypothetical protein